MGNNTVNPPRGMRDILPDEMHLRTVALNIITSSFERFGFKRIETPAIEDLNILSKDSESDNTKLIFSILKRGEDLNKAISANDFNGLADLGLRYDLTVPLARYYTSNRSKLPNIFKSIQIGTVWRAERPQKGRYRQFYQCDIDILGNASLFTELELINASAKTLLELGFNNFIIRINDRRILSALISFCNFTKEQESSILISLDKLDKIGIDGVRNELNKYSLDQNKVEKLIKIISTIVQNNNLIKLFQQMLEKQLDPKITTLLNTIIEQLNALSNNKYQCIFDPTLVRGMGYYTGPIFEINYKNYPFSIAGGGRYDQMISQLTNSNVPACGISLGFERLIGILADEQLLKLPAIETIALIYDNDTNPDYLINAVNELWKMKQYVTLYQREKNFSKQLNELLKIGISKYIIIEKNGTISSIKEIESRSSTNCSLGG